MADFDCVYLRNTNFENCKDWEQQYQWLRDRLKTFHQVFAPRIEAFDAIDFKNGQMKVPDKNHYRTFRGSFWENENSLIQCSCGF